MKKSSLGRRNSNRPSSAMGWPSADVGSVRKSGIPVPQTSRSKSTERPSASTSSRMNRAGSSSNLHMMDMMTPAKTPLSSRFNPGQGERPSRATSYGTSSVGTSSYGGNKAKRDNRPLQEKEWQAQAYNFIENIINQHPSGADLLGPGLKPLSLNKFIDACDLLLKMLDGSVGITKHNYIKELPFLLGKKMSYKGKMEKSWMIAVNTQHAIPYALGLLHFLAQCANILLSVDIESLMFPRQFDSNNIGEMNFKLLIPFYNSSYELRKSNARDCELYQEELNQQVMQQHYYDDEILAKRDVIAEEMATLQEQYTKMMHEHDLAQQEYEAVDREYNNSLGTINDEEEKLVESKIMISSCKTDLSDIDKAMSSVDGELELLREEHSKLLKKAKEQAVSHKDIEIVKKRRDSLDREIISNQKYIQSYQDMVYTEDLEIVKLKTEIEELTRMSNLRVMKYVPLEQKFEKMILPTKMEELDLSALQLKKEEIQTLTSECSARSKHLISEKAAAESERDQVKKALIELESTSTAQQVKNESLKSEYDSMLEALNKEERALEAEIERMNSEFVTLQKHARDLKIESDSKKDQVSNSRRELEESNKIMAATVKSMEEKAVSAIEELTALKKKRKSKRTTK